MVSKGLERGRQGERPTHTHLELCRPERVTLIRARNTPGMQINNETWLTFQRSLLSLAKGPPPPILKLLPRNLETSLFLLLFLTSPFLLTVPLSLPPVISFSLRRGQRCWLGGSGKIVS